MNTAVERAFSALGRFIVTEQTLACQKIFVDRITYPLAGKAGILRVTPGFGVDTTRCSYDDDDVAAEYRRTIRGKEVAVSLEASGLTKCNEFIVGSNSVEDSGGHRESRGTKTWGSSGGLKDCQAGNSLTVPGPEIFRAIIHTCSIQPSPANEIPGI